MRVFVATKDVNLFGRINIKKNDKVIFDNQYNLTHDGILYESPINQIGLELLGILFSIKETRNYKLNLLGIR